MVFVETWVGPSLYIVRMEVFDFGQITRKNATTAATASTAWYNGMVRVDEVGSIRGFVACFSLGIVCVASNN